jgi:cysteinyl-tRNA synthetase
MYTCGLTVYARGHIGNFRTFVASTCCAARCATRKATTMRHVMNFTDVDDKTILESQKAGVPLREYTDRYIAAFREDAAALGLEPVEENAARDRRGEPAAMGETIKALERAATPTAATARSTSRSRRCPTTASWRGSTTRASERRAVDSDKYDKEDARDFVLWKATKPGEPTWDPTASARAAPGWHIECSAMALRLLGEPPIDIHAGGIDLIFPHHENEIAQSEGATGKPFARFWVHVEHLLIEDDEAWRRCRSRSATSTTSPTSPTQGFRAVHAALPATWACTTASSSSSRGRRWRRPRRPCGA